MRRILSGIAIAGLVGFELLGGSAIASTIGHTQLPCRYVSKIDRSKFVDEVCNIDYGSFLSDSEGWGRFMRVHWSDGVQTNISWIPASHKAKIDGTKAVQSDNQRCSADSFSNEAGTVLIGRGQNFCGD